MQHPHFFYKAFKTGFKIPNFQNSQQYFPGTECLLLDGKKLSDQFIEQAKTLTVKKTTSKLVVILVGDNKASAVYVKNKLKTFEKAHFSTELITIASDDASDDMLIEKIEQLNTDSKVCGILVQLPLPKKLKTDLILSKIKPKKDVDGFSSQNLGLLALNDCEANIACTPFGVMLLLNAYGIKIQGKHCVIVGRSRIVGKPMGLLLLNENATVTFVHSHTENIYDHTKKADILIVAVGKKHFINQEHIKPGSIIIDIGIHKNNDGTLSGDVNPNVRFKAHALTPVPKGVGPMTIAALLVNTSVT